MAVSLRIPGALLDPLDPLVQMAATHVNHMQKAMDPNEPATAPQEFGDSKFAADQLRYQECGTFVACSLAMVGQPT